MGHDLVKIMGILLGLMTLPGTIELAFLTLGGILPPKQTLPAPREIAVRKLAVIIPAHNEERFIGRAIESLRKCEKVNADTIIVVVADNCTDGTEAAAKKAGARVLVRHEPRHLGKGYALNFAAGILMREGFDAIISIDADSVVDVNFIKVFYEYFSRGAELVQCAHLVLNPQDSLRTRLLNAAMMSFNVLRPRARDRWGLSAGCMGNGFGLTKQVIKDVPFNPTNITEDLDYQLRLIDAGHRIRFANQIVVKAQMPVKKSAIVTQRTRWEGGRFRMALDNLPSMFKALFHGRWRYVEPLLELLTLPLSYHTSLLLIALILPWTPTRSYAFTGLMVVVAYTLAGIIVGKGGVSELFSLLIAPYYMAWKIILFPSTIHMVGKNVPWVRTDREPLKRR